MYGTSYINICTWVNNRINLHHVPKVHAPQRATFLSVCLQVAPGQLGVVRLFISSSVCERPIILLVDQGAYHWENLFGNAATMPNKNLERLLFQSLRSVLKPLPCAGKTCREVAQDLGRSIRWVKKWWQRHQSCDSLEDKPCAGRLSVLSLRAKDLIRKTKGKRHQSCRRLSRRLKNLSILSIVFWLRNWVWEHTEDCGFLALPNCKWISGWLLQRSMPQWPQEAGKTGCPLYLFSNSQQTANTDDRKKVPPSEQVKFSTHCMVWGAMSSSGLSKLHVVPQGTTINAEYYVKNILHPVLLPLLTRKKKSGSVTARNMFNRCVEMVFVQDGAPAHTALSMFWAASWLSAQRGMATQLPGPQPCWGILNSQVFHSPPPTTMKQLNARAVRGWGKIEPSVLKNVVHSLPDRLRGST